MNKNLSDFCLVNDNALSVDICDAVLDFFHRNEDRQERWDYNKSPKFNILNFTQHAALDQELHNAVVHSALTAIEKYRHHVPESIFWTENLKFEYFRIKHYRAGTDDQFKTHIDSNSKETYARFLAFFWYLNDVDIGGETEFTNIDLKIKPKKGRLVMFPPLWLYPHRGNPTISQDKFMLSSYLHCA